MAYKKQSTNFMKGLQKTVKIAVLKIVTQMWRYLNTPVKFIGFKDRKALTLIGHFLFFAKIENNTRFYQIIASILYVVWYIFRQLMV